MRFIYYKEGNILYFNKYVSLIVQWVAMYTSKKYLVVDLRYFGAQVLYVIVIVGETT